MPRWFGTFGVDSPLWNRFVTCEAESADVARARWTHRGLTVSMISSEAAWSTTNWAGHTMAQRQGLQELTPEEEQQHVDDHARTVPTVPIPD